MLFIDNKQAFEKMPPYSIGQTEGFNFKLQNL